MEKIILIIIAIIFATSVGAHDTKKINYDSKKNCTKNINLETRDSLRNCRLPRDIPYKKYDRHNNK